MLLINNFGYRYGINSPNCRQDKKVSGMDNKILVLAIITVYFCI